jgi:hypothetical protein
VSTPAAFRRLPHLCLSQRHARHCFAVGFVLGLAAITATFPASAVGQTPVTAFVHVSVIPMDRERVLADHTVLVQDGHITALGP